MDIDGALEHALNGQAILFVGSGFSRSARNVSGDFLMTGAELGRHLSGEVGLAAGTQLQHAADEYIDVKGEAALLQLLRSQFTVASVSAPQRQIASVPWRSIFTTNYDSVVERAASEEGKAIDAIVLSDDRSQLPRDGATWCLHLNGYIERLTRGCLQDELKLTEGSYLSESISSSPWMSRFRQELRLARAVFIVGYSLADIDIARLLRSEPEAAAKTFLFVGNQADDTTVRRLANAGTVERVGTDEFATILERKRVSYTPPAEIPRIESAVRRFTVPSQSAEWTGERIFDLLLTGETVPALTRDSLYGQRRYFLERAVTGQIVSQLRAEAGPIVVCGELGNGKTAVLEGLKYRMEESGHAVYEVIEHGDDAISELDTVLRSDTAQTVIIDDYTRSIATVEFLAQHAGAQLRIVLAARTSLNDTYYRELCRMFAVRALLSTAPMNSMAGMWTGWSAR